jgi:hypothetical protein
MWLAAPDRRAKESIAHGVAGFMLGGGGVCVILGVILIITGTMTACPKCGKWWARVYLGRTTLEKKRCYGLVTRYAHSSSTGWISGTSRHSGSIHDTSHDGIVHSSGTTSWQERVPVIRTTYELHYECKYCQAHWTKVRVEQVEDFERA